MAKAKKKSKGKRLRRLHQEPIVREVAHLLDTGVPTKWRYESACRHGLRAMLCLKGEKWQRADNLAQSIVELALHRIGASKRPAWNDGQHFVGQREYHYCDFCCGKLDVPHDRPWCSDECRMWLTHRRYVLHGGLDEAARATATRIVMTGGAERPTYLAERRCKQCEAIFKPKEPQQRYCSQFCSTQDRELRRAKRDCLICAEPYVGERNSLYCSKACINEAARRSHRARRATLKVWHEHECRICTNAFESRNPHQVICGAEPCVREHQRRRSYAKFQRRKERESQAVAEPEPAEDGPARVLARAA